VTGRRVDVNLLTGDHHVHSSYSSDARDSVADDLAAARARGLTEVCLADHVRSDTAWVDEYRATVRAEALRVARLAPELTVHCAVEAKILDRDGRVDAPRLSGLDRVLLADHQYPGVDGPVDPARVRQAIAAGHMSTVEVVDTLVTATTRALWRVPGPQLAHLFSLLPKVGLDEDAVTADHLAALAVAARDTAAVVELNEKWRCPGPAAVAAFTAAGVRMVASTDSHRADDVGVYDWVAGATDA
jgi:putative hydrolase